MGDTAEFEWRPGLISPMEDHLTYVDQIWCQPPPDSHDTRPYVWCACGLTASAEGEPVGVPCQECSAWLAARPSVEVRTHG